MNNIGVGTNATERLWKLRKSNPPVEKQGIMGMAGIGQTTLAEQVYHDSKVVHCFAFHAWNVSDDDLSFGTGWHRPNFKVLTTPNKDVALQRSKCFR